jgi:hypothetical protein
VALDEDAAGVGGAARWPLRGGDGGRRGVALRAARMMQMGLAI